MDGVSQAHGSKTIGWMGTEFMPKLTKRHVDAAAIQAADYFIWDDDLAGFGLRILPSGRKGYMVQYRVGRRSRRISLGSTTVLTCEQARTRAIAVLAAARNGVDLAAKRDADRQAITVKELAERFDAEHVTVRVKESTAKGYRRLLKLTILPAFGRHRVTEVTRADVAKNYGWNVLTLRDGWGLTSNHWQPWIETGPVRGCVSPDCHLGP